MNKNARMDLKSSLVFIVLLIICSIGVLAWTDPIVTLESPTSGTFHNGSEVEFNVSWTGAVDVGWDVYGNLTLFLNGARNISYGNSTGAFVNDTEYNLTVWSMHDGIYIWTIQLWNSTGGPAYWASDNYTLTIDSTDPLIGDLSPADNNYATTDALTVTAKCNDTNPALMKVWVNGVVNKSYSYVNATSYTFAAIDGFTNGKAALWTVSCTDDYGNEVWATNRTQFMDLEPITLTSNNSNNDWNTISSMWFNISYSGNKYPDTCLLFGDFNRSGSTPGYFNDTVGAQNQTLFNKTGNLLSAGAVTYNYTNITLQDTNDTGKYSWNIWCNSSGGRTAWLSTSGNITLGVDSIPPSSPDIKYLSTEYYTNLTQTVRRWRNMSYYMTTSDQTPEVVFLEIEDVNDITVTIAFDDDSDMASPEKMYILSGANVSGTMTVVNHTKVAITGGRPYTRWYYTINVTDEAGHVNWSFTNASTMPVPYQYRVSAHGANLTEDVWNPIGFARPSGGNISLGMIMNETNANYLAVYNISHDFITCSATNNESSACYTNITQGSPIWIYTDTNSTWDYSWWDSTGHWTPNIPAQDGLGYSAGGGILNLTNTNVTSSSWNYMAIMNWSHGCTFGNLESLMNNTYNSSTVNVHGASNWNETGQGNITFMSFYNYTEPEYYPYYWEFGSPWNETKMEFRDVVAVWVNTTAAASRQSYFNRSGC